MVVGWLICKKLLRRILVSSRYITVSILPEELQLRIWQRRLVRIIRRDFSAVSHLIQDVDVIIDVGANVGSFTQFILQRFPNCKAYLFEPVPKYYDFCRRNFSGFGNVTVENYALSDKKANATIYLDKTNLGWNTVIKEKTTRGMRALRIKEITFDEYARNGLDKIDLIKIDVEGAEFLVLKGMKEILERLDKKPHILLEVGWGRCNHPFWDQEVAVFEWLFHNGYERFDYDGITSTQDVIIAPKARDT